MDKIGAREVAIRVEKRHFECGRIELGDVEDIVDGVQIIERVVLEGNELG